MKERWPKVKPKGYMLALSFNMLAALVDMDAGYTGEDSPRHKERTMQALLRRGFVVSLASSYRLTTAGTRMIPVALDTMRPWRKKRPSKRPARRSQRTRKTKVAKAA